MGHVGVLLSKPDLTNDHLLYSVVVVVLQK